MEFNVLPPKGESRTHVRWNGSWRKFHVELKRGIFHLADWVADYSDFVGAGFETIALNNYERPKKDYFANWTRPGRDPWLIRSKAVNHRGGFEPIRPPIVRLHFSVISCEPASVRFLLVRRAIFSTGRTNVSGRRLFAFNAFTRGRREIRWNGCSSSFLFFFFFSLEANHFGEWRRPYQINQPIRVFQELLQFQIKVENYARGNVGEAMK